MPAQKRHKTNYPSVYYIMGKAIGSKKPEKIFYIMYRRNGKQVHEKAGRQFQDDMTAARAARIRAARIQGNEMSNREKRKAESEQRAAEANKWTIERLWEAYKTNKPNLKGIVTDENRFSNYIKPNFGEKEPYELVPLDVDRLRINLLKTKSPGTVKNVLELLRRVVNFGVNKNLCNGLKFKIEMPKVNSLRTEDLTPEQLTALLDAIEKDTNIIAANMMKIALYTGMRRGEMFKLKWKDIDFDKGFIKLVDTKGGTDENIPLNSSAREVLNSHMRTDSEYVFPGRGGRQRKDIKVPVNRIKKRAGLPKAFRALHGLRHVYASMLASSGQVDMYTLQKLLTHKSPTMTQRYAHLRDDALKKASDLAGSIIDNAVKKPEKDKIFNSNGRTK